MFSPARRDMEEIAYAVRCRAAAWRLVQSGIPPLLQIIRFSLESRPSVIESVETVGVCCPLTTLTHQRKVCVGDTLGPERLPILDDVRLLKA